MRSISTKFLTVVGLLAITFFAVLASVGGSLRVDALDMTIPAYFLVGAVVYAISMSGLASIVGAPLVGRIQRKNHQEGVFRYELMKVREDAKEIAAQRSEIQQAGVLHGCVHGLGDHRRDVLGPDETHALATLAAQFVQRGRARPRRECFLDLVDRFHAA